MSGITDAQFQAAADRLPSTPQVFSRLSMALHDPNVDVDDISAILRLDAALSARLLRLSNSATFMGDEPASDLTEAVQRVGFREVFRLVGLAMSSQLYIQGLPVYGMPGTELWENSLAVALALERLAPLAGDVDERNAYTVGLLRPIGRLLVQRLAAASACAPLSARKETASMVIRWEQETFGLTSVEAAERLFGLWGLPGDLGMTLRYQFRPWDDPEKTKFSALVYLAGWVAEFLGKGLGIEQNAWGRAPEALAQAQIEQVTLESCAASTAEAVAELSKLVVAA
jgi:HD-like signal output (HDOD) protein